MCPTNSLFERTSDNILISKGLVTGMGFPIILSWWGKIQNFESYPQPFPQDSLSPCPRRRVCHDFLNIPLKGLQGHSDLEQAVRREKISLEANFQPSI